MGLDNSRKRQSDSPKVSRSIWSTEWNCSDSLLRSKTKWLPKKSLMRFPESSWNPSQKKVNRLPTKPSCRPRPRSYVRSAAARWWSVWPDEEPMLGKSSMDVLISLSAGIQLIYNLDTVISCRKVAVFSSKGIFCRQATKLNTRKRGNFFLNYKVN